MTQVEALKILKTGANVFLTGEPGSGKTHVINEYVAYLRSHGIEPAVTASTGIAATHIGGYTIHSWSGIGIKRKLDNHDLAAIKNNDRLVRRIKRAKVLVIDEISMLLAETLDLVNLVCRKIKNIEQPFGGLQIIFVGDFFQLPPINNPGNVNPQEIFAENNPIFAYSSLAWGKAEPIVCYLEEQFRQDDRDFLSILSAIRHNEFNEGHLQYIKKRKILSVNAPAHVPKLFSHNIDVDRVNKNMLDNLQGASRDFEMSASGPRALVAALVKGCLSPEKLQLKIGAAVMFTKNNISGGFVNGTLGTVVEFDQESRYPIVKTKSGKTMAVGPMDWTIEENSQIRARINQLPLRLAWAITVHKSQGMSLDEAVMDLSAVFEYGQGYVALSRIRRLSGLHILGWNRQAFMVHPEIIDRDNDFRKNSTAAQKIYAKLSDKDFQKKWQDFIIAGGGELELINIEPIASRGFARVKKVSTNKQTLIFWRQGKDLAGIAKARNLKQITILGHLEKLNQKGEFKHEKLDRLLTPGLRQNLDKILNVFQELETDRLSPVFEKLNGEISYDDLRIARMIFIANARNC